MKQFTEEERLKAQKTRQNKIMEMKRLTKDYKKVWLDENLWVDVATSRGIRLPPMYVPATAQSLRKWARKLTTSPFLEHFGCSPDRLIALNPKTPLRVFVGQMLEP